MPQQITKCKNCGAGPKFIASAKEPVTNNVIIFCGQCHKVQGSSVDGVENPPEYIVHLKKFAMSMAGMFVQSTGTEVVAHTYTEGIKMGVQMALSVPSSEKESYWMEKYGVVKKELQKELENEIAQLNELVKEASDPNDRTSKQAKLKACVDKLAELHRTDENPGIRN